MTEIIYFLWSHHAKKFTLKKLNSPFGNRKIGESTLFLFFSHLLLGKQKKSDNVPCEYHMTIRKFKVMAQALVSYPRVKFSLTVHSCS